jgi:hypothetical protein
MGAVGPELIAVALAGLGVSLGIVGNWFTRPASLTTRRLAGVFAVLLLAAAVLTWVNAARDDHERPSAGPSPDISAARSDPPSTSAKSSGKTKPSLSPRHTHAAATTKAVHASTRTTRSNTAETSTGGGPYPPAPDGYPVSVSIIPSSLSRSNSGGQVFSLTLPGATNGETVRVEIKAPTGGNTVCSTETKRCGLSTLYAAAPYDDQTPNFGWGTSSDDPTGNYTAYVDLVDRHVTITGTYRVSP